MTATDLTSALRTAELRADRLGKERSALVKQLKAKAEDARFAEIVIRLGSALGPLPAGHPGIRDLARARQASGITRSDRARLGYVTYDLREAQEAARALRAFAIRVGAITR